MKNDSVFFRDRKLTQSSRRNQFDIDQSARFNTSTSIINVNLQGSNHSQLKKIIVSLEKSLKQEKQKNIQAQDRLMKHIQRATQRQQQFHAILANANSSVYMQVSGDTNIHKLYQKVMGKVTESQQKMREKFEMRYKENLTIMERKIKGIIDIMEGQLRKASTLSEQEHGELKANVNRLEAVALEIDQTNTQLMKTNAQLEFKVNLLKEEKSLLIQELNEKKSLCKKYYSRAREGEGSSNGSRAHSQVGEEEKRSEGKIGKRSSVGRREVASNKGNRNGNNKNGLYNNQSSNFAIQLVKSKMFSDLTTPRNNIIQMTNNTKIKLSQKKDYISTMTIGSINPQLHVKINTQTSRNNNYNKRSPYLLTKAANSYHSTLVNSTIKPINNSYTKNNSHPLTPHNPQSNTITSLRNIIARQRQKKIQYQSRLAEVQQKIIAIDKVVVDSLVLIKENEENEQNQLMSNQIFKKTSQKIIQKEAKVQGDSEKGKISWLRTVCNRIKSIITGNGVVGVGVTAGEMNNAMTINISPRNTHYVSISDKNNEKDQPPDSNQFTNQELLEMLQGV